MESIVYFNGQFRPESEATLSVRSRALNYGLGCFAGIRGIAAWSKIGRQRRASVCRLADARVVTGFRARRPRTPRQG
jgi:branched-subunit amino acid aminotransferase/4-amino-4-deoxychorismate lyase